MSAPEWVTPVLAFVGAGLGSGLSYLAAQKGTRQRESQAGARNGDDDSPGHRATSPSQTLADEIWGESCSGEWRKASSPALRTADWPKPSS